LFDAAYSFSAYTRASGIFASSYDLQAFVRSVAKLDQSYALNSYALFNAEFDSSYALNSLVLVVGKTSDAYAFNAYQRVASCIEAAYGLGAFQHVTSVSNNTYSLSAFRRLYGTTNTGYKLNAWEEVQALLNSGYELVATEAFGVWAVNIETGAVTRYTNFPFTSFAWDGTRMLATAEDGIYVLGGDDDDRNGIFAAVDTGPQKLGTDYLKRMVNSYIGLRNDGHVRLSIESDDGVRTEHTIKEVGDLRLVKLNLAKGQRGNYFRFQIDNVYGADFEVDMIGVLPEVLSRRRAGAR